MIVDCERVRVASLVDAELVCIRLAITTVQLESKCVVKEAICDVRDCFPVEACGTFSLSGLALMPLVRLWVVGRIMLRSCPLFELLLLL